MTRRADFVHQINTDPDNDLPRLLFADWLEENGNPDYAEFIRLQIRLANLNNVNNKEKISDTQRSAWDDRVVQLEKSHRHQWLPDVSFQKYLFFQRGIGEKLKLYDQPAERVAAILNDILANQEVVAEVRQMELVGCGLDQDVLALLMRFPELHSLNLFGGNQSINDTLIQVSEIHQIRSLYLTHTWDLIHIGFAHLARMTQLQSLKIPMCRHLDNESIVHLAKLTQLRVLNMANSYVTDTGLAQLHHLTNLVQLNICGCHYLTFRGLELLQIAMPDLVIIHHIRK